MTIEWSDFYNLNEENVRRFASASAGVYLLCVQLQNNGWSCYYVGQAQNLEERLLDHTSYYEPNECIKETAKQYVSAFVFARVGRQGDRDGIEKFLYDHYKPKCNKTDPGGTPIDVKLP